MRFKSRHAPWTHERGRPESTRPGGMEACSLVEVAFEALAETNYCTIVVRSLLGGVAAGQSSTFQAKTGSQLSQTSFFVFLILRYTSVGSHHAIYFLSPSTLTEHCLHPLS